MKPKKIAKTIQSDLFSPFLADFINMDHSLVRLAQTINWKHFEDKFDILYSTKGRTALSTRLMLGLHYLKYSYDLSDVQVVHSFLENPYYQYFCGEKRFQLRSFKFNKVAKSIKRK